MASEASLDDRLAGSVPFCTMSAVAVAGWQLQRQAQALAGGETPQAKAKAVIARYFASHIASEARGLKAQATAGSALLYALDAEALAG